MPKLSNTKFKALEFLYEKNFEGERPDDVRVLNASGSMADSIVYPLEKMGLVQFVNSLYVNKNGYQLTDDGQDALERSYRGMKLNLGPKFRDLFNTELNALAYVKECVLSGKLPMRNQIYDASGSNGHPKYVIGSLLKKGMIDRFEGELFHFTLTEKGAVKLEEAERSIA
jgi:predicted transcriptional regulator